MNYALALVSRMYVVREMQRGMCRNLLTDQWIVLFSTINKLKKTKCDIFVPHIQNC